MKKKQKKLYIQAKKRQLKKVVGTELKPRLAVFRSHVHIYGQLIDDKLGKTLTCCSTLDKEIAGKIEKTANQDAAFLIGSEIAKRALKKDIHTIIFDRGDRPYHGRIRRLAEGARNEGLIF
jgi:large subunit ribosomal protein L18